MGAAFGGEVASEVPASSSCCGSRDKATDAALEATGAAAKANAPSSVAWPSLSTRPSVGTWLMPRPKAVRPIASPAAVPASPEEGARSPERRVQHSTSRYANFDFRTFLNEAPGSVFDFYEKLGDLGEGAFGDVWLARERVRAGSVAEHRGREVAVKRVRKPNSEVGLDEAGADSEEAIVDFRVEVELMKALDHPGCCRLLEVFEDAKNIFLVMEHIRGGELFQRLSDAECFGESEAAGVVRQVASALAYCHAHGVVHRDIKPENILLVDPEDGEDTCLTVKVIDFGFGCRILRGAKLKAKVGTFLYTAPEALKDEPCDEGIDNWALGCVLFSLLSGNSPFYGPNCRDKIVKAEFSMDGPEWAHVSEGAKDLVRGLLVADPAQRVTAAQVHSHPWISEHAHSPSERGSLHRRNSLASAAEGFKDSHNQSCLRHLCTGILARQMDEVQLHQLHETFCLLDEDDDGILSFSEVKKVWAELGVETPERISELFADVDMDASGHIDYTEFVAACLDQRTKQQEEALWDCFRVFDTNGDGKISHQEMLQVVQGSELHGSLPKETLHSIWHELTGIEVCDEVPEHLAEADVDFDTFLAVLGNVETRAAAGTAAAPAPRALLGSAGEAAPPAASPPRATPCLTFLATRPRGGGTAALPIAGRRGADAAKASSAGAAGLPIAGRGAAAAGLPIAGRGAAAAGLPITGRGTAGGGLPIAGRHKSDVGAEAAAPAAAGLPIAGKLGPAGLPLPPGGGAGGLPIKHRGSGDAASAGAGGLPIASKH